MTFPEFRLWFDARFSSAVTRLIDSSQSYSGHESAREAISYILALSKGGKRVRPFLVYCGSGQSDPDDMLDVLIAVELVHVFALIHDDIMDKSSSRHGVTCAHEHFGARYGKDIGVSIAILLGDLVFAWAYEHMVRFTTSRGASAAAVWSVYTTLIREVIHGQLIDVIAPAEAPYAQETILEKMTLKTARYSFARPLQLGAAAYGVDGASYELFGTHIGIAFQIQDDLLNLSPDTVTGKTAYTDIREGQQTLISWFMEHRASEADRAIFRSFVGKTIDTAGADTLKVLLEHSGALAFARSEFTRHLTEARRYCAAPVLPWQEELITLIERRTS